MPHTLIHTRCGSAMEPLPLQGDTTGHCPTCDGVFAGEWLAAAPQPALAPPSPPLPSAASCEPAKPQSLREQTPRQKRQAMRVSLQDDWTADALVSATLPEPPWIVPGLLPVGLATLGGRPKTGKSWLALQLAVAVACGGRFLDLPIERGKVLYIALEDSPRRLQQRLRFLHLPPGAPLAFALACQSLSETAGLIALQNRIVIELPDLVIIDTLARATSQVAGNSAWPMAGALAGLQRIVLQTNAAILTIDHHRKQAGFTADPVDDVLGSTGKSRVIDTALGLYHPRGEPDAILRATGRDIEDKELALTFHSGTGWTLKGDARAVAQDAAEEEALAALARLGKADTAAIARELGKARPSLIPVLKRLESRGQIHSRLAKARHGGAGKILYSLPQK
jgi:hypothetical protein